LENCQWKDVTSDNAHHISFFIGKACKGKCQYALLV